LCAEEAFRVGLSRGLGRVREEMGVFTTLIVHCKQIAYSSSTRMSSYQFSLFIMVRELT
jgi:hypothetical protein